MKHTFKTNRKAFTLIELLIVIAIIGILFIVLVSKVDFATDKAKTTGVQTDFRSFQVAFETVSRENSGFNTLGWDTGDNAGGIAKDGPVTIGGVDYTYANAEKDAGDRVRNSYDVGDLNLNGKQDANETFTGRKIYTETWTGIYTLDNPGDADDKSAYIDLEKAINANLDPALRISIDPENKTIYMANGYQDPWKTEYHGFYLTNAKVDGKDRGAIVMYSDGPNKVFGSEQSIANGKVTVTVKNGGINGQDDLSIITCYTYTNGYGEIGTITTGFSNNQQMQAGGGNGGPTVVEPSQPDNEVENNPTEPDTPDNPDDEKNLIPLGATYYIGVSSTSLGNYSGATQTLIGDGVSVEFPETVNENDVYIYGDYEYRYNNLFSMNSWSCDSSQNGWGVSVRDKTKVEYEDMLSEINGKPVTMLHQTFYNCTNIVNAPAISINATNMTYTFNGCTSLETAPNLNACTNLSTLYGTFSNCTKLKTSPSSIPANVINMESTFYNCNLLEITPDLSSCTKLVNMNYTFYGCYKIISVPTLPSTVRQLSNTFYACRALKTYHGSTSAEGDFSGYVIPSGVTEMYMTFGSCKSIEVAPAIPETVTSMYGTFQNCDKLVVAPVIPNNVSDMSYTFWNCTALATAPVIPASVTQMLYTFNSCTALKGTIEINANPTSYSSCFQNTVERIDLIGSSTVLAELAATDGYSDASFRDNVR